MLKLIQEHTNRKEVRDKAFALLMRRDGLLRTSIPTPREAHAMVLKEYGMTIDQYRPLLRAAYDGKADEKTTNFVAEVEATVEIVRAIPRMMAFIRGVDTSMPVMFLIGVSKETMDWIMETAEKQCLARGFLPYGYARWHKALYG